MRGAEPTVGRAARLLAAGFAALLGASGGHAAAQTASAADATLVRGLEAQFEVGLIRERKLADDRESQFIAAAETRLSQARAAVDAAKGEARQTAAELAAARADYARLAADVVQADATARAEIAAYR